MKNLSAQIVKYLHLIPNRAKNLGNGAQSQDPTLPISHQHTKTFFF